MYQIVKRVIDMCLSVLLLAAGLPLIIFGLVGSAIIHRSNPLFIQQRTGLNGVPFYIYKIKSMRDGNDSDGDRLTRFGSFLRASSIDELPQFINILHGDMSFIGPRPQLHSYYDLMSQWERRRYEVKPGLSGWSQVNGRNGISWSERFEQDVWYVENACLMLDFWITLRTVQIVLFGRGVSNPEHTTMPPLEGRETNPMPGILEEVIRNSPNAAMSFSLHDPDNLLPVAYNPHDLLLINSELMAGNKRYDNIFIDIWRRPSNKEISFPAGTAGPFTADISSRRVVLKQLETTSIRYDKQKKHSVSIIQANNIA